MFDAARKIVDYQKKADHENMKHTQLAVRFEAHFKRPIIRQCITRVGVGEIVAC